jgi:hypothetical protein
MKITIKQRIQDLLNEGKSRREIVQELVAFGIKKTTIAWYFNKLKSLTPVLNETN